MAERYRVLTGMNYGDHERRLEPGDLTPVEPEVVDEAPVELAPGESDPAVGDQE
jgi:hypothetical protein